MTSNVTGWHTLYVNFNGGAQPGIAVYGNGMVLVPPTTQRSVEVPVWLNAGQPVPIMVQYNTVGYGGNKFWLDWSSESFGRRLIPAWALAHFGNATGRCALTVSE